MKYLKKRKEKMVAIKNLFNLKKFLFRKIWLHRKMFSLRFPSWCVAQFSALLRETKKNWCSEKFFALKNFLFRKIFALKNHFAQFFELICCSVSCTAELSRKICVQKIFLLRKIFGSEKSGCSEKSFRSIFRVDALVSFLSRKICLQNFFLLRTIFYSEKFACSENSFCSVFWADALLSFLSRKNYLAEIYFFHPPFSAFHSKHFTFHLF